MTKDAAVVADELPDSPAGRQVRWFLEHVASNGRSLTVEEVADHMALAAPWTPSDSLERFRSGDGRAFNVAKIVAHSATEIDVTFDYGDDKPFRLSVTVDEQEPYRIVRTWWARAMADDIVIRPAVAGDSEALNGLEVRAPMTLGAATKFVYDRGEDFLAFARLMEDNVCFVAERDGELLGIACGARHSVRIGGQRYTVMLLHHLRVPIEHRKGGIFSTLNGHVFGAYDGRTDGAYGYTSLENAEAMRIGGPGTWNAGVFRAVIDCAAVAGPQHGRNATPADAPTVVDILNRGHTHEEVYLPYSEASLTARLERAPDLYTWEHLRVGDGAVLGVWPAGLEVTIDDGTPVHTTRAVALDHGFIDGAQDQFERLLRAYCGELLKLDHTELTFMTSEGSPNYPLICELAHRMDPFAFRMAVPEPPGTIQRGVYVDAVYF
jgi:hypothetical protein